MHNTKQSNWLGDTLRGGVGRGRDFVGHVRGMPTGAQMGQLDELARIRNQALEALHTGKQNAGISEAALQELNANAVNALGARGEVAHNLQQDILKARIMAGGMGAGAVGTGAGLMLGGEGEKQGSMYKLSGPMLKSIASGATRFGKKMLGKAKDYAGAVTGKGTRSQQKKLTSATNMISKQKAKTKEMNKIRTSVGLNSPADKARTLQGHVQRAGPAMQAARNIKGNMAASARKARIGTGVAGAGVLGAGAMLGGSSDKKKTSAHHLNKQAGVSQFLQSVRGVGGKMLGGARDYVRKVQGGKGTVSQAAELSKHQKRIPRAEAALAKTKAQQAAANKQVLDHTGVAMRARNKGDVVGAQLADRASVGRMTRGDQLYGRETKLMDLIGKHKAGVTNITGAIGRDTQKAREGLKTVGLYGGVGAGTVGAAYGAQGIYDHYNNDNNPNSDTGQANPAMLGRDPNP